MKKLMINKKKYKELYNLYKVVFDDIIGDFVINKFEKDKITFKNPINIYYLDKSENDLKIGIKNQTLNLKVGGNYKFEFIYENDDIIKTSSFKCNENSKEIYVYEIIKEKRQFGYITEEINKVYSLLANGNGKFFLNKLISKKSSIKRDEEFWPDRGTNAYYEYDIMRFNFDYPYIEIEYLPEKIFFKNNNKIGSNRVKVTFGKEDMLSDGKEDITNMYLSVKGDDCVSRIYDLYKGFINYRNAQDLINIYYENIPEDAFAFSYILEDKELEDKFCGSFKNSNPYCQDYFFIYYLIHYVMFCNNYFDINDYKSIKLMLMYNKYSFNIQQNSIDECLEDLKFLKDLKSKRYNQINLNNTECLEIIEGIIGLKDYWGYMSNRENFFNKIFVNKKKIYIKK